MGWYVRIPILLSFIIEKVALTSLAWPLISVRYRRILHRASVNIAKSSAERIERDVPQNPPAGEWSERGLPQNHRSIHLSPLKICWKFREPPRSATDFKIYSKRPAFLLIYSIFINLLKNRGLLLEFNLETLIATPGGYY